MSDLKATKPDWWIRRFLYGSFENREGLVYPVALDFTVDPLKYRIIGRESAVLTSEF